jgi:hypothetical protein
VNLVTGEEDPKGASLPVIEAELPFQPDRENSGRPGGRSAGRLVMLATLHPQTSRSVRRFSAPAPDYDLGGRTGLFSPRIVGLFSFASIEQRNGSGATALPHASARPA